MVEEYLEAYANFLKGNYKDREIRDTKWAEKFILEGRKIVFPQSFYESTISLAAAGFVFVLMAIIFLYITIPLMPELNAGIFAVFFAIYWGIIGIVTVPLLIIPGLSRHRSFFTF